MSATIRYRHSVNVGDLVASLAGIKSIYEQSGRKAIICQEIGRLADYYSSARHPVTNEHGQMVTMNMKQWEMVKPLLLSQEYVANVEIFTGQHVNVDLDRIRSECFVNMPYGHLGSWIMLAFPDMHYDLSKKWLHVPKSDSAFHLDRAIDVKLSDKVLLNFTERYRTNTVQYFWLKQYEQQLVFAGLPHERDIFCERWKLDLPLLIVDDFLELAKAIKECKFLMGNQSSCWNISNSMSEPRLLEMSSMAPNCIPFIGEKNYGYFHTGAAQYYFTELLK